MTPEEWLGSVPDALADDVALLATNLEGAFARWTSQIVVSNPIIGSRRLGILADGDLILDDCLIEIKCQFSGSIGQ